MEAILSYIRLMFCIALQILLFNRLQIFGGIVLIYLYALLKTPLQINRSWQIIIGFVCGLLIDIFSNTIGVHAFTCTLVMYLRQPFLRIYVLPEDMKMGIASIAKFGMSVYVRHALIVTTLHTVVLYLMESFTLFNFTPLLLRILMTWIMTVAFILVLEIAFGTKK